MFCSNVKNCCKDLKCKMENQGEKLVITISGKKEDIATVEKKLTALHTLCCSGAEGCC